METRKTPAQIFREKLQQAIADRNPETQTEKKSSPEHYVDPVNQVREKSALQSIEEQQKNLQSAVEEINSLVKDARQRIIASRKKEDKPETGKKGNKKTSTKKTKSKKK